MEKNQESNPTASIETWSSTWTVSIDNNVNRYSVTEQSKYKVYTRAISIFLSISMRGLILVHIESVCVCKLF